MYLIGHVTRGSLLLHHLLSQVLRHDFLSLSQSDSVDFEELVRELELAVELEHQWSRCWQVELGYFIQRHQV
jgi:hypothetical protein